MLIYSDCLKDGKLLTSSGEHCLSNVDIVRETRTTKDNIHVQQTMKDDACRGWEPLKYFLYRLTS